MRRSVVNGDRWISQRLQHLRDLLRGDLSEEQRQAAEAEIATLSNERGIGCGGGYHLPRVFRRFRKGHEADG